MTRRKAIGFSPGLPTARSGTEVPLTIRQDSRILEPPGSGGSEGWNVNLSKFYCGACSWVGSVCSSKFRIEAQNNSRSRENLLYATFYLINYHSH